MSPKLPRRSAVEVRRGLERHGYRVVRQSGSHQILRNDVGIRVTLSIHPGDTVHPKILKRILNDTGLSAEELLG